MQNLSFPVLRNADADKNQYRGFAMAQMRILLSYMQQAGLKVYSRTVRLANGVVITCKVCYDRQDVFVDLPVAPAEYSETVERVFSGIVMHPRSGVLGYNCYWTDVTDFIPALFGDVYSVLGVVGGWKNGASVMTNDDYPRMFMPLPNKAGPYPLMDNDNATFVIGTTTKYITGSDGSTNSQTDQVAEFNQPGLYGNMYWDNGKPLKDDKLDPQFAVLSWRGPPGRHFRIPNNTGIPGLSAVETVTVVDFMMDDINVPIFTVFGNTIYQGGKVFMEAPAFSWPQIVQGTAAKGWVLGVSPKYLIVLQDHMYAPKYCFSFSDGAVRYGESDSVATAYISEQNALYPLANPKVTVTVTKELTKPGFFLGVWTNRVTLDEYGSPRKDKLKIDGWEFVGEHPYSREGLPWFANTDGNSFICSNGKSITITESNDGATSTFTLAPSIMTGTYQETTAGTLTATATVPSTPVYTEFQGNDLAVANGTYNFSSTSAMIPTGSGEVHGAIVTNTMLGSHILHIGATAIPILQTHRNWRVEYSLTGFSEFASAGPSRAQEDYEIIRSKIHYVDLRYGVCLYNKRKETVQFDVSSTEEAVFQGQWGGIHACQIKLRESDMHIVVEDSWHLVIDGIDTILKTTTSTKFVMDPITSQSSPYPLFSEFTPEEGILTMLVFPQPPSMATLWTNELRYYNFYDYGHDPNWEQWSSLNEADGGYKDFFFPIWCRGLQENPAMTSLARERFLVNLGQGVQELRSEALPEMNMDPLPVGSFVRHPLYGDVWQFLCGGEVFSSLNIVDIEEKLNLWFTENPHTEATGYHGANETSTEHTHDTTLYYPLGII